MSTIKGILSFPCVFTPKAAKGATEPKFSASVLLEPNDPQTVLIQAEVDAAKANAFPSGYTGADCCLTPYDTKYAGKDYYDPRFAGWWVFSCSAKADDRPAVVDANRMPVVDPATVYGGMVVYLNAGISGYTKGKGGIGGWLNGVLLTDETPPMGRLDNKPSVEQMFADVPGGSSNVVQPAPNATPPAPPVPPVLTPSAPAQLTMTAAANGVTYEQYMATPGWTDEMLIAQGLAIKPSFA